MKCFTYTITGPEGIHGRPAAKLVSAAKALDSQVLIEKDGRSVDAAHMIALMMLGIQQGDTVTVTIEGGDEEAGFRAMERIFREEL